MNNFGAAKHLYVWAPESVAQLPTKVQLVGKTKTVSNSSDSVVSQGRHSQQLGESLVPACCLS